MDLLTGLPLPTPAALAEARGDLTPAQAGRLVGLSEADWIGYETDYPMPMTTWALFLLATHQHPFYQAEKRYESSPRWH